MSGGITGSDTLTWERGEMITINLLPVRYIPLTQDYNAVIDKKDYPIIAKYKWWISKRCHTNYAQHSYIDKKGIGRTISMHRLIMGLPSNKDMFVDHINHDGLDNRMDNLRLVSCSQSMMNSKKCKSITSSKYKGVWFQKNGSLWTAEIHLNGKREYIGWFKTEIEAAKAYNKQAKKLFGDYCYLNEIT